MMSGKPSEATRRAAKRRVLRLSRRTWASGLNGGKGVAVGPVGLTAVAFVGEMVLTGGVGGAHSNSWETNGV